MKPILITKTRNLENTKNNEGIIMKKIFFAFLIFMVTSICYAEVPELVIQNGHRDSVPQRSGLSLSNTEAI